ncbi:MAG: D-alanine--D-alanine ligase family protein [Anaerovoracaceae bacterium]
MDRKRIGIIFGGKSGEHEVSLLSAASVIRAIDKEKFELHYIGITRRGQWMEVPKILGRDIDGERDITADIIEKGSWEKAAKEFNPGELKGRIDFALPIMHGPYCEDGKIQGMFEILDIPYGGCGVVASAVAMDKVLSKKIFEREGLPICRYELLTRRDVKGGLDAAAERIEESLGYPCFVKPANMGSSVGVSKAADRQQLKEAVKLALEYDKRIIVEEFIDCREIETAVIGNDSPEVAAVGEILPSAEFYDYNAKYCDGGASKLCIPADISEKTADLIKEMAQKAYMAIDGEGFARIDFFIDKKTGKIYINEINTIPGFTKYSMFPLLWEAAGVKYGKTIERIIELGYERYYAENSGQTVL